MSILNMPTHLAAGSRLSALNALICHKYSKATWIPAGSTEQLSETLPGCLTLVHARELYQCQLQEQVLLSSHVQHACIAWALILEE